MDPENASKLFFACLLLLVMAVIGIVAPQALWALSSWRYRNAEAMEPTEAQYTVHRARYAALLSLCVPPLIGLAWPGEGDVKVRVWMISAVASVAVIVAVLVLVGIMRRKRRESTINHDHPSELSDAGYGVEWFGVVYTFIYVLVIVAIFAGLQASADSRRQEALDKANHTMTAEEKQHVQDLIDKVTASYPTPVPPQYVESAGLPVYTAVPEGAYIDGRFRLQTNEAGAIRLAVAENVCPLAGIVVVESSVNVSMAVVLDASAAGATDPAVFCTSVPNSAVFMVVAVPVALEGRAALTIDGDKLYSGTF